MRVIPPNTATAALRRIAFSLVDATDLVTPEDIAVSGVKVTLAVDGGTPAASTNDIVKVNGTVGEYYVELTQAESDRANGAVLRGWLQPTGCALTKLAARFDALERGTDGANTVVPPTVAQFEARTLPSGSYSTFAGGPVASVTDPVTVGTNNDKTGYSLTQGFPDNFASLGINASGHVSRVTLVDTTTTNTDMRGTDDALLDSSYTAPPTVAAIADELESRLDGAATTAAEIADAMVAAFGVIGSVNDGSATTTGFAGNAGLSASDDFYNGSVLQFTSGALDGIARRITDYTGSTRTLTFTEAFPSAPANADAFVILGRID